MPSRRSVFISSLWQLIFVAMVAAQPRFYTNVKDFGAIGDGVHDDTSAIIAAIQATSDSFSSTGIWINSPVRSNGVVYFPSGTYRVGSALPIENSEGKPNTVDMKGEGGSIILQTDPDADILSYYDSAWRCTITGLSFVGGKNQIYLNNGNTDKTFVVIEKCQFINAGSAAVRTGEQLISTQLTVRDCAFTNCMQVLISHCDKARLTDSWITTTNEMKGKAVIENYGDLLCDNICGVPGMIPDQDPRWIDNHRRVTCRNFRFGGESAGFTAVVNFAAYEYVPEITPNSVVLEDCDIYVSGNLKRAAAVYCEEIPNQIVIRNCRGLPAFTDPALTHAIMIDPKIDLDTYFDKVENLSRPKALRYFVDPAVTELYWNEQGDLPEQMRPYQAGPVEADTVPRTGWWRKGTFVRNRNADGSRTPIGWLCTQSGKPGVWKALQGQFTNP